MTWRATFSSVLLLAANASAGGPPDRAPDLVMVLDATCSMSDSEIDAQRDAAHAFLDCINTRAAPESRLAVVTFGGVDFMLQDMTELVGGGYAQLDTAIAGMVSCRDGGAPCSNTNHASGYDAAVEILDRAATPPQVGQTIVFVSDGSPAEYEICRFPFYAYEDAGIVQFDLWDRCQSLPGSWVFDTGRNRWAWIPDQGRPNTADYRDWCDLSKAEAIAAGVDTYTVYYGSGSREPDGSPSQNQSWMQDHILAGNGFQGWAPTPAEITDRMLDVCVAVTGP